MHSIRWRFISWLGFLLLLILAGFGVTAYQLHRTNQLKQTDQEMERRVAALGGALRGPRFFDRSFFSKPTNQEPAAVSTSALLGPPENPPPPRGPRGHGIVLSDQILGLFDQDDPNGYYFIIFSNSQRQMLNSTNAPFDVEAPLNKDRSTQISTRIRGIFRERYYFNGFGECVLVGRSMQAEMKELRGFAIWLIAAGAGILALGIGGSWLIASRALQPVDDITMAANRISDGNLAQRINVAETDSELGKLAKVLNSTFARLESAFSRQKQFTADASHELRTPLAVLISEAQTALNRKRTPDEYRETIEVCLDTAQQMRRLTDSLLQLARSDSGEADKTLEVDLAEVAQTCASRMQSLAQEKNVTLQCSVAPARIRADRDRIAQVLYNLLSNAIDYNHDGGSIVVSTRLKEGKALLEVSDTGRGISAEDLPHIFERFYRADKSRSRSNGHHGLGLAICKAIVEADGGKIRAESEPGKGARFTVEWPG